MYETLDVSMNQDTLLQLKSIEVTRRAAMPKQLGQVKPSLCIQHVKNILSIAELMSFPSFFITNG
jgi:hypothetical protein